MPDASFSPQPATIPATLQQRFPLRSRASKTRCAMIRLRNALTEHCPSRNLSNIDAKNTLVDETPIPRGPGRYWNGARGVRIMNGRVYFATVQPSTTLERPPCHSRKLTTLRLKTVPCTRSMGTIPERGGLGNGVCLVLNTCCLDRLIGHRL